MHNLTFKKFISVVAFALIITSVGIGISKIIDHFDPNYQYLLEDAREYGSRGDSEENYRDY